MPTWKKVIMFLTTPLPSFLRVWIYKTFFGARIGPNVKLKPLSVLIADDIEIGSDTYLDNCTIVYNLRKFHIGKKSSIRFGSMVYGHGGGSFHMGDFGMLSMLTMVNCTNNVKVGDYFGAAPRVIIYSHGNFLPTREGYKNQFKDVTIGNFVWLHMNVVVLPGVTIGDNVMVFAQSLVLQDVPSGTALGIDYHLQRQIPMNKIRQEPTPEYKARWYTSLWDDLPEFVHKYHRTGNVVHNENYLQVTVDGQTIRIYDGMKTLGGVSSDQHTLVTFLVATPEQRIAIRDINWMDFENCYYNFPHKSRVLARLVYYLELYRAQYCYQWPGA